MFGDRLATRPTALVHFVPVKRRDLDLCPLDLEIVSCCSYSNKLVPTQ